MIGLNSGGVKGAPTSAVMRGCFSCYIILVVLDGLVLQGLLTAPVFAVGLSSLEKPITHNIMNNYIARDNLTDFVEKMWDAGMRTELIPKRNTIAVIDSQFHAEYVDVLSKQSYETLIDSLIEKEEASDESDS